MGLYASVEDAIFRRFESFAPQQQGRQPTDTAKGGDVGHRILPPVRKKGFRIRTILGGHVKRVPVLYEDKASQDANLWPAFSFRMSDERPRREDWRQQDDLVRNVGTAFVHNSRTLAEVSGPDLVETIVSPDPVTLVYEFRVWSTEHDEAQELLEIVKASFPINGFLELQANDKEIYTIDMLRVDGPNWVGGIDPTLVEDAEGSRFYSWSLTYDIEAYEDNTLLAALQPTIRQRSLEYVPSVDQDDDPENAVVTLDVPGEAPPS